MHIPDDPLYHEKFYFAPGDLGFQAWQTRRGKIGVCVCWDQWYPEAARLTALRGAEIIFYPTAIGWHPSEKKNFGAAQHSAWETHPAQPRDRDMAAMSLRQIVSVKEAPAGGDGIEFWGQSFVCGQTAKYIAKGSVDNEEIVMADVVWSRVNVQRARMAIFAGIGRVDAYAKSIDALIGLRRRAADHPVRPPYSGA
jgi:N-carbamoylputrescine amidase